MLVKSDVKNFGVYAKTAPPTGGIAQQPPAAATKSNSVEDTISISPFESVEINGKEIHGAKKAGAFAVTYGAAALGATAGFVAATLGSAVASPLIGMATACTVFRGTANVNGKPIREYLSPFQVEKSDSMGTKFLKNLGNEGLRAAVATAAGIAAAVAAPVLVGLAGGFLGLEKGGEASMHLFRPR